MTLYEQVQRERATAQIVEDIYSPPIDKAVMLVDLRPRVRRLNGRCAVRVEKPRQPMAPDATVRAVELAGQAKGRGS